MQTIYNSHLQTPKHLTPGQRKAFCALFSKNIKWQSSEFRLFALLLSLQTRSKVFGDPDYLWMVSIIIWPLWMAPSFSTFSTQNSESIWHFFLQWLPRSFSGILAFPPICNSQPKLYKPTDKQTGRWHFANFSNKTLPPGVVKKGPRAGIFAPPLSCSWNHRS